MSKKHKRSKEIIRSSSTTLKFSNAGRLKDLSIFIDEYQKVVSLTIIVTKIDDTFVGLIVDLVSEVLNIPPEDVSPPPRFAAGASNQYIKGMGKVGDKVKILLDITRLLGESEIENIKELAK